MIFLGCRAKSLNKEEATLLRVAFCAGQFGERDACFLKLQSSSFGPGAKRPAQLSALYPEKHYEAN